MSGNLAVLDDVLAEGTDGQYVEVDLTDGAGAAIDTGAISGITGTLRSLDTEEVLFGGDTPADLLEAPARASYPEAGVVRVTFTTADMAVKGSRALQTRELTLTVTHSGGQVFACAVQFRVRNLRDV